MSKTRQVLKKGVLLDKSSHSNVTSEFQQCPVCLSLGSYALDVIGITPPYTGGVTPWSNGGYGCLRCGLRAPKYAWAIMVSLLETKVLNE